MNQYLFQLSYTFGNVLSPRLVERYTERDRIEDLRGMVEVPLVILSQVVPAMLGVVSFAADGAVRLLLPDYVPALTPLQILLLGTWFASVPRGLSSFFITIRRQGQTIPAYIAAILVNAGLVWWLLARGHGLPGAAAATSVAEALLGSALVVMALRYFMRGREIAAFLLRLAWPPALALALIAAGRTLAGWIAGGSHYLVELGLGGAIFLAGYAPVLFILYRRHRSRLRG